MSFLLQTPVVKPNLIYNFDSDTVGTYSYMLNQRSHMAVTLTSFSKPLNAQSDSISSIMHVVIVWYTIYALYMNMIKLVSTLHTNMLNNTSYTTGLHVSCPAFSD